jgi:hypothetical protein
VGTLLLLCSSAVGQDYEMKAHLSSGATVPIQLSDLQELQTQTNALGENDEDTARIVGATGAAAGQPREYADRDLDAPVVGISISEGQVLLSWSTVPGAFRYNVYECSNGYGGAESFVLSTEATSVLLPLEGEAGFYRVRAADAANTVVLTYNGTSVTVDNPLESAGVAVQVVGADATVTSTAGIEGIDYVLAGSSSDGMFKVYSDQPFNLHLDGLTLTNLNGPAINIQADEEITVELVDGTSNALTDGVTYASPPAGEDQKAAFFSEGQLIFTGTGSLTVHGRGTDQHALGSDDYIDVQSGTIVIQGAVKDGIHTNEGYFQQGGSVDVTSDSDGVDAGDGPVEFSGGTLTVLSQDDGKDALKCDSGIVIAGGELDFTIEGDQSKGLNAPDIQLTGGTVTIHTSGGMVLEASGSGYDPSYCTAVKGDTQVLLNGCQLTVTAVGPAGRGISCDGDILIQSGSLNITSSGGGGTYTNETGVTDAYHGPCLTANGDIALSGGTVTLHYTGSGGRGITTDSDISIGTALSSPTLQVTTTGSSISLGGGEYFEAKSIKADSAITVNNGNLTLSSVDDALKAEYRIDIYAGLINIVNSKEGIESPNLYVHGGEIHLNSTDDGLNATYGVDGEFNDGSILTINGGWVHLNAPAGDAIDSNGSLTFNGGTILVHGPGAQPEVGVDVNGTFKVNGGLTVVSQINSNMVEVPSSQSTQRCVLFRRTQALSGGTLFHVEDTAGTSLVTFAPARNYSCILFSSADITAGTTYRVYTGGTCTGTVQDGLYNGGTYSGGTLRATFTSTSMVQTVNF